MIRYENESSTRDVKAVQYPKPEHEALLKDLLVVRQRQTPVTRITRVADSQSEMERLVFVRYMYRMGIEQAMQPEPMNAVAVLLLHDSVDLFLQVSADRVRATTDSKKSPYLKEYFALIDAKLPAGCSLGHRLAMIRLNDTRNLFKHQGVRPTWPDVEALHRSVTSFLLENTPLIFGVRFDDVSMARLVALPDVRTSLEHAERLAADGDRDGAVEASATAYAYLRHAYLPRENSRFSTFGELSSLRHAKDWDVRSLAKAVEHLAGVVERGQEEIERLVLDVTPAQMSRFQTLTPSVMISFAGSPLMTSDGNRRPLTDDDVRFCYDFVVGLALRLQRRRHPK